MFKLFMSFSKTQFKLDFSYSFLRIPVLTPFVLSCTWMIMNKQNVRHFINLNWLENKRLPTLCLPLASRHKAGSVSTDVAADGHVTRTRLGRRQIDIIMTTIYWVSPRLTDWVGLTHCNVKGFQICQNMQTFFF